MNEFDLKASEWDKNPMHWERSEAVANEIKRIIPLNREMTAMEYGAGTGITSFLLKDLVKEIILMDNSPEMVKVINNKIETTGVKNLKPLRFDLEHAEYKADKFDLIFTQMVLHHVADTEGMIQKFYSLLNHGGYLAIADLYSEDGSFHGDGFTGHKGFGIEVLSDLIRKQGFTNISHRKIFTINKEISVNVKRYFDVFLLIAEREKPNK